MRELGLEDVFAWSEILDKLDIRKEIANIQEDSVGKKDAQTYAGVQIMALLFSKMYKVKKPLLKWIADFTNKSYEEVAKMTIKELKNVITEIMQSEELTDLFSSLVTTEQV